MKLLLAVILLFALTASADTYLSRLQEEYETGNITADEFSLYCIQSVLTPEELPAFVTDGATGEPCGTPALHEASLIDSEISESTREILNGKLVRPVNQYTYDSSDGYFKIHYDLTGSSAVTMTYVYLIADAMDSSWNQEVINMVWDEPPSDGSLGGDNKYDVYIQLLTGGVLGYCSHYGEPSDPTSPEHDSASHIVINSTNYGDTVMEETCAHEFKHAIQFGYDNQEATWYMENCAVWMENEVWPYNGYADYLHAGQNALWQPYRKIYSPSMYWYGASIWPMYIQVRLGGQEIVRETWEEMRDNTSPNTFEALEDVALNHGMDINQWYAEYADWRYFTGNRADNDHYLLEESSLWTPGGRIYNEFDHDFVDLPVWNEGSTTYEIEKTGHNWIRVETAGNTNLFHFEFDGNDDRDWQIGVMRVNEGSGTEDFTYYEVFEPEAEFTVDVPIDGWDYIIFIVQGIDGYNPYSFGYCVYHWPTGIEGDPMSVPISLNPSCNPIHSGDVINFSLSEAGFTTLNVYDVCGRMVQNIVCDQFESGEHSLNWNAGNLTPGAYFLRLSAPGGIVTSRIILN